jgi:hypothetical protein
MNYCLSTRGNMNYKILPNYKILQRGSGILGKYLVRTNVSVVYRKPQN